MLLPKRGCPLSQVTLLELFHGLRRGGTEHLDDALKAVNLASRLSRRKILLLPIPFMQRELFQINKPGAARSVANLNRLLERAIKPNFKSEFVGGSVKVAHLESIERLFTWSKKGYRKFIEQFLDGVHPDWRSERDNSGSPLPKEERERLKRTAPIDEWKRDFAIRSLVTSGIDPTSAAINAVSDRCDAYVTFMVSVLRDAMITSYRFEENSNDFNDGMQLLYLCRLSFCLVTDDERSIARTKKSTQSNRILTIDQFVSNS